MSTPRTYGWFVYREEPRSIQNFVSGQQLVIEELFDVPGQSRFKARYVDAEIQHTLQFSLYCYPDRIPLFELSYADAFATAPTYGVWRRIDDFMTDALLCWPDYLDGMRPFELRMKGAWHNGAWSHNFERQFHSRKSGKPDSLKDVAIAEPYLVALDMQAPAGWALARGGGEPLYVDHDELRQWLPSFRHSESLFRLNSEFDQSTNVPFLPLGRQPAGFQGKVPYLYRLDGTAWIVFADLEPYSHRGEDPAADLYYTYIDDTVFFTFRAHQSYGLELGSLTDYGFREALPHRSLWARHPLGELIPFDAPRSPSNALSKFAYPSYRVWQESLHALTSAWPAWGMKRIEVSVNPQRPLSRNMGRSARVGDYGPTITHGFSAGLVNGWFWTKPVG